MTDKMHENWAKPTVPVWEEIKPPQVYGTAKELVHSLRHGYPSPLRIEAADVIDKQAAEIDALRKRVQELESAHQEPAVARGVSELETVVQSLCVWGKFQDDAGEATNALSDLLEQLKSVPQVPPPDHRDAPQPPIEKGRLDVEGHPV